MKQNKDIQNVIYNLSEIKKLREESPCRGITYGRSKKQTNPLRGSHVIIIEEKAVIIISSSKAKNSPIYFFQYIKSKSNKMAKKIKPIIKPFSITTDINEIRNIPEIINMYENASGKGRSYGINPNSELFGSHITLIEPKELLIIRQHRKNKKLKLFCFKKGKSPLGEEVKKILNYYKFKFLTP